MSALYSRRRGIDVVPVLEQAQGSYNSVTVVRAVSYWHSAGSSFPRENTRLAACFAHDVFSVLVFSSGFGWRCKLGAERVGPAIPGPAPSSTIRVACALASFS